MKNNNKYADTKSLLGKLVGLFLLLLLFLSCDDEGITVEDMHSYHDIAANWYYYGSNDNAIFRVSFLLQEDGITVDSVSMSDTLTTSNQIRNQYLTFSYPEENTTTHVVLTNITDPEAHVTELNTTVDLRENREFSFLKMSETDDISIYSGSSTDEENPSKITSAKYQFYYNIDNAPDSLRLVVFSMYDNGNPYSIDDLSSAIDSIVIYKGQFSDYIEINREDNNTVFFFMIKDANNNAVIQDIELFSPNAKLTLATGYSNAITENKLLYTHSRYYLHYKFMTVLIYDMYGTYEDKVLFTSDWKPGTDFDID